MDIVRRLLEHLCMAPLSREIRLESGGEMGGGGGNYHLKHNNGRVGKLGD